MFKKGGMAAHSHAADNGDFVKTGPMMTQGSQRLWVAEKWVASGRRAKALTSHRKSSSTQ